MITSMHAHHYLGFAASQERLFEKTGELKPALYLLRVLLTGLHLMRTGRLETDLPVLGASLPYVPDLIAAKRSAEHAPFPPAVLPELRRDAARLRTELEQARDASHLPAQPSPEAVAELHDLVVRTRLATVHTNDAARL